MNYVIIFVSVFDELILKTYVGIVQTESHIISS
jgi:hypothetical protein